MYSLVDKHLLLRGKGVSGVDVPDIRFRLAGYVDMLNDTTHRNPDFLLKYNGITA